MSQYLDVFDDKLAEKLFKIMNKHSDNQKKAKLYTELLREYGFVKLSEIDKRITTGGLGTNQLVLAHPQHKKVVYKFALDSYGVDDNFYDEVNSKTVERHSMVYERHYTNIVAVHKRYRPIETFDEIQKYLKSINKALKKLSEDYILVDLSPKYNFKNYGIDEETNDWVFIDCSDIIPLHFYGIDVEIKCQRVVSKKEGLEYCKGELVYTDAYHTLECVDCGHVYNPIAFKPKIRGGDKMLKNSNFHIGLSTEELSRLCDLIVKNRDGGISLTVTEKKPVENVEADDDEDDDDPIELPDNDDDEEQDDEAEKARDILRVNRPDSAEESDDDELSDDDDTDEDDDDDTDEDDDDTNEETTTQYPIEAYDWEGRLKSIIRNEVYTSFEPVGEKLLLFPTKVKDIIVTRFEGIEFHLADAILEIEIDSMILAVEEKEIETTFGYNNTGSLEFFNNCDNVQEENILIAQSPKELFNSYHYNRETVQEKLHGMVDKKEIEVNNNILVVKAKALEEVSKDDFIENYSLMFKKYGTSSSKLFEVLIKDCLGMRF
jgi:hypothetical protein